MFTAAYPAQELLDRLLQDTLHLYLVNPLQVGCGGGL